MADYEILPSRPEHYEAIRELAVKGWQDIWKSYRRELGDELFDAFYTGREDRKRDCVLREAETGQSFVAVENGRVIAFINYKITGDTVELASNAVDPACRGRGIGGELQRYVLNYAKRLGCVLATVETGGDEGHAPARRSYEKAGFEKCLPSVRYFKKL